MIDDATVYRLGPDNFRFVGGDEYDGIWLKELADRHELKVWIKPSTEQLHNLAVQGPASREILKEIVWTPPTQPSLEELRWFRFLVGRIEMHDGIPIVVSRTGYTGELGYEVWCHPTDGTAVWDAIWRAGAEHGLTPLGLEALDILRIESGLIFAGYEFDDQVDPSRPASASPSTSTRTRTSSAATRSPSGRLIRSACWSGSSSRGTRLPGTGTTSTSDGGRSESSRAARAAPC